MKQSIGKKMKEKAHELGNKRCNSVIHLCVCEGAIKRQ